MKISLNKSCKNNKYRMFFLLLHFCAVQIGSAASGPEDYILPDFCIIDTKREETRPL